MTPHPVPTLSADELVKRAIARVESKSRGRTRFDGQEPYDDEILVARIIALESQLARKDEALKPFAAVGAHFNMTPNTRISDGAPLVMFTINLNALSEWTKLTAGDLRRAAEALSSTPVQAD